MDHISTSLSKRLNQRSLASTATAAYVCHVANGLSGGRYRAVSLNRGTLTVAARSSAAAHDVRLLSEALLGEINAAMLGSLVARIRVIVRR